MFDVDMAIDAIHRHQSRTFEQPLFIPIILSYFTWTRPYNES